MFAGKLAERVNGVVIVLDQNHMRLDWAAAFEAGLSVLTGPIPKTGYSDVALQPDSSLHGSDFALGLPPRHWTARMIADTKQ
jgi:hypothetical protein